MVEVGVIAIDGTKMHANASQHATRDYERIARQILGEADAVDREEDERYGHERGDELPPELASREGRAAGCAAPSAISMSGAPSRPGRSRTRARSGLKEAQAPAGGGARGRMPRERRL